MNVVFVFHIKHMHIAWKQMVHPNVHFRGPLATHFKRPPLGRIQT